MLKFFDTKLLLVIVGLLATITAYCAYELRKEHTVQQTVERMNRAATAAEKRAMPSGFADALKRR